MQQRSFTLALALGLSGLCASAGAQDGIPDGFSIAVDQAWEISQRQQLGERRLNAITAGQDANRGWFAGAPELSGRYSGDQVDQNLGRSEVEVEVGVPLWLSGQQQALDATLASRYALQQAALGAEKLELAGLVRERYWELMLKRNDQQSAQSRLQAARKIGDDVQRHIDNGILADNDRLLARAEILSAEAHQLAAQQALYAAERAYLARTGLPQSGHWTVEPLGPPRSIEAHPQLRKALAEVALARAELQRTQVEDREHARLSVALLSERDSRDDPYSNRIQVGFSLPLGRDPRGNSAQAEASADLLATEVRLQALKRSLESDIVIALSALESARLQQQSAQMREQISRQRATLEAAAFAAGELGLQGLLLSRNHHNETRQALQQRQIEVARALSRVNQALGYLPGELLAEGIQ